MSERQLVWVGRWTILVLSAIAYVAALYVPGLLVTIGLVALAGTAQVIVPTVGALFWKRSTTTGAIAGLLVGIISLVFFTYMSVAIVPNNPTALSSIIGPFAAGGTGLLALLLNIVVFVLVSLVTKPRESALLQEIKEKYVGYFKV